MFLLHQSWLNGSVYFSDGVINLLPRLDCDYCCVMYFTKLKNTSLISFSKSWVQVAVLAKIVHNDVFKFFVVFKSVRLQNLFANVYIV